MTILWVLLAYTCVLLAAMLISHVKGTCWWFMHSYTHTGVDKGWWDFDKGWTTSPQRKCTKCSWTFPTGFFRISSAVTDEEGNIVRH